MRYGNAILLGGYELLPELARRAAVWGLIAVGVIDLARYFAGSISYRRKAARGCLAGITGCREEPIGLLQKLRDMWIRESAGLILLFGRIRQKKRVTINAASRRYSGCL